MKIIVIENFEKDKQSYFLKIFEDVDIKIINANQQVAYIRLFEGILELQYYLHDVPHRLNCDQALYRFEKLIRMMNKELKKYSPNFLNISLNYINQITQVKWNGYWHNHKERYSKVKYFVYYQIPNLIQNIIYYNFKGQYEKVNYHKKNIMKYSNLENEFFLFSIEYIKQVLKDNDKFKENYAYCVFTTDSMDNLNRYINFFEKIEVLQIKKVENNAQLTETNRQGNELKIDIELKALNMNNDLKKAIIKFLKKT